MKRPGALPLARLALTIFLSSSFLPSGFLPSGFLPSVFLPLGTASAAGDEQWILVDTVALTLSVMRGNTVLHSYNNISIGSIGPTYDKVWRDEKTPLGEFRINEIRPSKRFYLFLSIDYPNSAHAERAWRSGRISEEEYRAIKAAREQGNPPPQNTPLGGNLGIHGIGSGSLEIHRMVNWTDGCVALTNEQIEQLVKEITVGTRIRIR